MKEKTFENEIVKAKYKTYGKNAKKTESKIITALENATREIREKEGEKE